MSSDVTIPSGTAGPEAFAGFLGDVRPEVEEALERLLPAETESPSGYLGAEFLYEFRNNIDFTTRARYFPNFDDYDLSLFVWEAALTIPLCEGVSIALTARWDYVLDPPAPTESSDFILTMGLQANF